MTLYHLLKYYHDERNEKREKNYFLSFLLYVFWRFLPLTSNPRECPSSINWSDLPSHHHDRTQYALQSHLQTPGRSHSSPHPKSNYPTSNQHELSLKIDSILEQLKYLSTTFSPSTPLPTHRHCPIPTYHLSSLRFHVLMVMMPWNGSSKSHNSSTTKGHPTRTVSQWHHSTWMALL